MMTADRPASFLPTITCSSCGRRVEISMMGQHICEGKTEEASPSPSPSPPTSYDRFLSIGASKNGLYGREPSRLGRYPPSVDTSVANRNYSVSGQLTPASTSSGSLSVSPKTPISMRHGAGRSGDDYYTPKIAGEFDSPASQQRRPSGYSALGGSGSDDLDMAYPPTTNVKKASGQTLLQRMNTIAPGPFDINRKPNNARNAFPSHRAPSGTSTHPSESGSDSDSNRPDSRLNVQDHAARDHYDDTNDRRQQPQPQPLQTQRDNGYGELSSSPTQYDNSNDDTGFEPPSFGRSGTFPRISERAEPPSRTPSAPGARPERRQEREPSNLSNSYGSNSCSTQIPSRMPTSAASRRNDRSKQPSMGPDLSRTPPPRTSLLRPRTAGRDASSNVPQINLAVEFGIGNPYHAPSDSMSSSVSSINRPNVPFSSSTSASSLSSASSMSTSASANSFERSLPKPIFNNSNDTPNIDSLLDDIQNMTTGFNDREAPAAAQARPQLEPEERNVSSLTPGRQSPPNNSYGGLDKGTSHTNPTSVSSHNHDEGHRPAVIPSRGLCKACGDPITGKSVSSADGRLTGRYHKACFVCTTCSEPFTSTTFYVHDDKPYCEQHYHEVNGSLCGTCGNGIEGPYLADESDHKHHLNCFVCADCGIPLRDGYFELDGKVFCERDAWKRVKKQQQQQLQAQQLQQQQQKHYLLPDSTQRSSSRQQQWYSPVNAGRSNFSGPPPRGLPSGPAARIGAGGLPSRPGGSHNFLSPMNGGGQPPLAYGLPSGNHLAPVPPMPRMEKRMTRLGMMN